MGESYIDEGMKGFILLTEELLHHYAAVNGVAQQPMPELVVEAEEEIVEHPMIQECRDLVFKLRAFMESEGGDYGLGVEMGMQRAAEMMENVIRRYEKGDDVG